MAVKSVLIAGNSEGGMDSALSEAFQKRGLHVSATARSLSKSSHLAQLPNIITTSLDINRLASVAVAVEAVATKTGGSLDYLPNNSGLGYFAPLSDSDLEKRRK
jgi:1-acylglycerone phosphate reductase